MEEGDNAGYPAYGDGEGYYDDVDDGAPSPQTEKQMEYLRNLQQRYDGSRA